LTAGLDYARTGDTLVVVKLDRAGRSLPHVIALLADFDARSVDLPSPARRGLRWAVDSRVPALQARHVGD
jgi:DNA invertase Pin-like site-specific DNA recombinase